MDHLDFIQKLSYLQSDFVGFSINTLGILRFFEIVTATLFLMALCYLIGDKLIGYFVVKNDKSWKKHFFSFGVGYVLIGTGVLILGMFSLVYVNVFIVYFLLLTILACYKTDFPKLSKSFKKLFYAVFSNLTFEKIIFLVLLFSVFLRLLPPEIGPDALDYHTGYPKVYSHTHTMMLKPLGDLGNVTIPQLSEMYYTVATVFGLVEVARYIHFVFFCLIGIFLWCLSKNYEQKGIFRYAPLLFASTPLVIHIAPSAYGDLQAVYLFLCAVIAFSLKTINKRLVLLSGIFFGGFLATKMFGLEFLPILILFFLIKYREKLEDAVRAELLFIFGSFAVVAIWFFRSYLLSAHLIYYADTGKPNTNTLFQLYHQLFFVGEYAISIKTLFTNFLPLFFLGLFALFLIPKNTISYLKKYPVLFIAAVSFFYIIVFFLNSSQRYFLETFTVVMLLSSVGLSLMTKNKIAKFLINVFFVCLAFYYLINSFLILPYGLGITSQHNYLMRQFLKDKSQYYDFGHLFSPRIGKGETVVTFGIWGHYYLTQGHINAYYFIQTDKQNFFKEMKEKHISKILLRGGNISWFCSSLKIEKQCSKQKFILLSQYLQANQYLYEVSY